MDMQTRLDQSETALCSTPLSVPIDTAALPEYLPLLPKPTLKADGNLWVTGVDGRAWTLNNPQEIIELHQTLSLEVPFDFEHSTELKAPNGEPAPATGWIKEISLRDGQIIGKVEWTDIGKNALQNKEYKYYSPAIKFNAEGEVVAFSSFGLTNRPNLAALPALNHQQGQLMLPKEIQQALGLEEGADVAAAVSAIKSLKAKTANNHDMSQLVPRTDLTTAMNRAETAETSLAKVATDKLEADIQTAINSAMEAKKISPSNKEYYVAQCRQENGLKAFTEMIKNAPAIIADVDLNHQQQKSGDDAIAAEIAAGVQ